MLNLSISNRAATSNGKLRSRLTIPKKEATNRHSSKGIDQPTSTTTRLEEVLRLMPTLSNSTRRSSPTRARTSLSDSFPSAIETRTAFTTAWASKPLTTFCSKSSFDFLFLALSTWSFAGSLSGIRLVLHLQNDFSNPMTCVELLLTEAVLVLLSSTVLLLTLRRYSCLSS
jgi:hypothetical protein